MESCDLRYKLMNELISESEKHPILDLKNRTGDTGYIDFITIAEVTSSIMRGIDRYKRKFIVLKLILGGNIVLQTIFQRYSNLPYSWRGCGHGTPELLFGADIGIGIPQLTLLLSVMRGETVKITRDHILYHNNYIDKDVFLFDKKRWDASKILQKNWRLCRENPKYKMCEKVQMHNIEDVYRDYGKVLV